jgi:choline kinase
MSDNCGEIDQVVILAAGQGERLRKDDQDYLKPLYPLQGRPLISYVINRFWEAGVGRFIIVVGFGKDELMPGIRAIMPAGASLQFVDNPDWRLSNGVSLLKAQDQVTDRFFLSMADHVFAPEMIGILGKGARHRECLYLAVDRKLASVYDLDDATKVETREDSIVNIDKSLKTYDAVDTGLFVCPPQVFDFLRAALKSNDCSLSDGVRAMASAGKARVVDIGDATWQDVDTKDMLAHAETLLAR